MTCWHWIISGICKSVRILFPQRHRHAAHISNLYIYDYSHERVSLTRFIRSTRLYGAHAKYNNNNMCIRVLYENNCLTQCLGRYTSSHHPPDDTLKSSILRCKARVHFTYTYAYNYNKYIIIILSLLLLLCVAVVGNARESGRPLLLLLLLLYREDDRCRTEISQKLNGNVGNN